MPVKLFCTLGMTATQKEHVDVSESKIHVFPGREMNIKDKTKNRRVRRKYFRQKITKK